MKICLQASPSCAAVVLNRSLYCCNVWFVMLKARWQPSPCAEHAERGRTEMSLVTEPPGRGWQQLLGENGQGLGVLLTRAGRRQASQVPAMGYTAPGAVCSCVVGLVFEMILSSAWGVLPSEETCRWKSMADEGAESAQGLPQPGTLVRDANCSWHGWSHLTISPLVWLWAKLYRMTRCRHHEAVRPIRPCKTAACKYQHFKWQLRLEMDCTFFP